MNSESTKMMLALAKTFSENTAKTDLFLGSQQTAVNRLTSSTKTLYDFIKNNEGPNPGSSALPELIIEDFVDEQIWQQLELQNSDHLCTAVTDISRNSKENVLSLDEATKQRKSERSKKLSEQKNKSDVKGNSDIEMDSEGTESDDGDDDDDDDAENDDEQLERFDDEEDDGNESSDDEWMQKLSKSSTTPKPSASGLGEVPSDEESEEEKELKALLDKATAESQDGDEDDDDEEEDDMFGDIRDQLSDDEAKTKTQQKAAMHKKSFEKTEVDDTFFKLAEMNEFLEQEDAKYERELKRQNEPQDSDDDMDDDSQDDDDGPSLFDKLDSDDDEEDAANMKYSDFFDPVGAREAKKLKRKLRKDPEHSDEVTGDDDEDDGDNQGSDSDDDDDSGDDEELDDEAEDSDEYEDSESDDDDDGNEKPGKKKKTVTFNSTVEEKLFKKDNALEGSNADVKPMSKFEEGQEKMRRQIAEYEEIALTEKPWQLKGEITAGLRPENSLIEESLDFDHATRAAPTITEETTKTLEDVIKQRIKDKSFDDVERKVKAKEEPYHYKKRLEMSFEKSKVGLGELYAQEYQKQQQKDEEEEDEVNPAHEEIKKSMQGLFLKLDALANYHFTPKTPHPELKVVNNIPSIAMEEVAPVAMSNAKQLAPEEIQEKSKTELKGEGELTSTDRKRKRREKKLRQKKKRKYEETKIARLPESKAAQKAAVQKLQKESNRKNSNVTFIKGSGKGKQGSASFFQKLQDEVSSQVNSKKKKQKREVKEKEKSVAHFKL